MTISHSLLTNYTRRNIERALSLREGAEKTASMDIEFPGFRHLGLGESRTGTFLTMFLDIRGSTDRAMTLGLQKTAATVHALLPTSARIVDEQSGFIVDYPGDGIMAHWDISDKSDLERNVINAVTCAGWIDDAVKTIINPLLSEYSIPPIVCAIGLSGGPVMITKIGIPGFTSTKAIGNSVNRAAKLTSKEMQPNGGLLVDKVVLEAAYSDLAPGAHPSQVAFTYSFRADGATEVTPRGKLMLPRETRNFSDLLSEIFKNG